MIKPIKGQPGRFIDPATGQVLNIAEYREDDKYDTVCIYGVTIETITAGKQYIFFRDIMRKQVIDTNFTQPSRLGAGEKMVVDRIGVSLPSIAVDDTGAAWSRWIGDDVALLADCGHLLINVNGLLLTSGPLVKYASGYGLSGGFLNMNLGVPSPAAVSRLLKTQTLTAEHEIIGYLSFYDRNWANWAGGGTIGTPTPVPFIEFASDFLFVKCWLHGLFKTAVNK